MLLQSDQILGFFPGGQTQKNAILKQLHQCKESLLRSETSATQVCSKIETITERLESLGIPVEKGRVLKPFPHVENLEADCSTFLVEANRTIRTISKLPSLFIPLERADKNFDHLGRHLIEKIGEEEALTKFVRSVAPGIGRIVDMRNYLEHPDGRRTIINNFCLLPDGKLTAPTWHLSGDLPVQIAEDMPAMIDFLIRMTEEILIHLVIYSGRQRFAFSVEEIAKDRTDPDFPIRFKLLAYLKAYQNPKDHQP